MKNSNDVVLTENEKNQVEALTQIANEQHNTAKNFNQQIIEGGQDGYVQANVTFAFSFGPDGGSCRGAIEYKDGRKIRYYGEATYSAGIPAAQSTPPAILALMVLPYEVLHRAEGKYYATGYGTVGLFTMTCGERQVFPIPLPVAGLGLFGWHTRGAGRFS